MKMRKLGNIAPWTLDIPCKGCDGIIVAEGPHDISLIQLGHNKEDKYYVICPVCGHKNELKPSDIREDIRNAIPFV